MSTSVSDAAPSSDAPSGAEAPAETSTLRARIGLVVVGVLVVLAAVGFGIITMFAGSSTPGIVSQTVTYHVSDTSVEINYKVAKPADAKVRCTLDAFDVDFEILAKKTIVVPVGKSGVQGTETLETPSKANGARIHECQEVG